MTTEEKIAKDMYSDPYATEGAKQNKSMLNNKFAQSHANLRSTSN
mgnify:CR=1 FL=1